MSAHRRLVTMHRPPVDFDFRQASGAAIAAAVVLGPTPTFAQAGPARHFNEAGLLAFPPHQLLANSNMSSQSGSPLLPAGWAGGVAGAASYVDLGGYWEATLVAAANRPKISVNSLVVIAGETYTIGAYIVSHSGSQRAIGATGTSGTDGGVAAATITAGGAGWYASGVTMGAADTLVNCQYGPGIDNTDTGTTVFKQPFILQGLMPGVTVGTTGVKLSGPPLGRWIGIENGAQPSYNQPLFDHNLAGTALGLHVPPVRTNDALNARVMTGAAWVPTNITAAVNATGIDGTANTASTLTATAANGTISQTVTKASAENTYSVWVRRKTGTGNIDMTDNGGTNYTAVTGLSAVNYTKYEVTRTQANPVIGFRIATSGDAIEVDCNQIETGAESSHPINTIAVAVARAVATCSANIAANIGAANTIVVHGRMGAGAGVICQIDDGTENERIRFERNASDEIHVVVTDGGVAQADLNLGVVADFAMFKVAARIAANDFAASLNGAAVVTDASGTLPTVTTVRWGSDTANDEFGGHNAVWRLWSVGKDNAFLQSVSA